MKESYHQVPSKAIFSKDDLVILDKCPVHPEEESEFEPCFKVVPLNGAQIRYDTGLGYHSWIPPIQIPKHTNPLLLFRTVCEGKDVVATGKSLLEGSLHVSVPRQR